MVVRWCLAAGLITAMLLASNYWHQGTEQSICKTLLDADGAWMSGHGIAGRYMGTKTPYNLLRQIKAVEDTETSAQDLKGCQVIKMYAVLRHGARYPTAKRTAETNKLKTALINRLGQRFTSDLHKHGSILHHRHFHNELSGLGMREQFCLAIRLKAKVSNLLQQPYSKQYYNFKSSQTSRTFKSALSFAAGLFKGQGPLDGYQPVDVESEPLEKDHILRFDEHHCPLYDKLVTRYKSQSKESQWQSSLSVVAIRKHLQTILDPGRELVEVRVEDVWAVYKLCVDESVQLERESYWCHLLSPSHLSLLHRISNIKAFWRKGGGFPITGLRSVHLVKDILDFMANTSNTKVAFRFGHSETLLPLLAFMELPMSGLMDFDTTHLAPFSANAIFLLHNCSSNTGHKLFLGVDLNESPVEVGLCPVHARRERHGLCPLEVLVRSAAEKSQHWKSERELCAQG